MKNARALFDKANAWTWLALLILTGANIGSSYLPLGLFNPVINFSIAFVKATLVMAVFMQLRRTSKLTVIFAAAGFFWLAILVALSLTDFLSRSLVPPPW